MQAELGPGAISGVNVQTQAGFMLPVEFSASTPARVRINDDGQRFTPAIATITPGAGVGVRAISVRETPLTRQTFRKLFRSERVDEEEGLGVRQVTFLFTDLKGSTALYERLGDLNAYALVRQHFALLDAVAQKHAGAIVKTIGDAVMAAS